MTEFEKWWATTAFTELDGPVPKAIARLGWDAAMSWSLQAIEEVMEDD